jgi:hypothetical protein
VQPIPNPAADLPDWDRLAVVIEGTATGAGRIRHFPTPATRQSLADALAQIAPREHDSLRSACRAWQSVQRLAACPVIAVTGLLNSGKTSLVASLLSPEGQARALRGVANREGTHRFVLWLPQSWRSDGNLWGLIAERLQDRLGAPPELLSDDPPTAHEQYNNRLGSSEQLAVPLIAFDAALDQRQIGLLDCPDIQTGSAVQSATAQRRDFLVRAASVCSAFLVVVAHHGLRDDTVHEILQLAREAMPSAPRLLAINQVRPRYAPHDVLEDATRLWGSQGIDRYFVAYDYEIAESKPFTLDDQFPAFFVPDVSASNNPPNRELLTERTLSESLRRLDRSMLVSGLKDSLALGLKHRAAVAVRTIDQWDRDQSRRVASAHRVFRELSLEYFASRDPSGDVTDLRLHQSAPIAQQLKQAFIQSAPWHVRTSMTWSDWVTGRARQLSSLVKRLTSTQQAFEDAKEKAIQSIKRGQRGRLMSADELVRALNRFDVAGSIERASDQAWLQQQCEQVCRRFEREDQTRLDASELDAAADQLWQDMPMKTRLKLHALPPTLVIGALAGAILIPMDGGGTAVLVMASAKELFLAAVGGAVAGGGILAWDSWKLLGQVESKAARQQLSNFHAILCDQFGVARSEPWGISSKRTEFSGLLPLPTLPVDRTSNALPVQQWQWDPGMMQSLKDCQCTASAEE